MAQVIGYPSGVATNFVLKTAIVILAVMIVAAPVAYAAFEIAGLSAPEFAAWRWPLILVPGVLFFLLSGWVVRHIHRRFPLS